MTDELFSLRDELSKMTGIRTPKELRGLCQEAINSISALSLPITSINHPVVTCITSIYTKYQDKYSKIFVPIICNCIINHVFSQNALTSVTSSLLLSLNEYVDWNTVHKLTSFLQTSVLEDFPDISVVQSYFSIVLQLMAHKDENISAVTYAAFQSMIDILIDAVKSYNKPQIPDDFLSICTDIFGMKSDQFEKPLYFILFLLFNDLSCISVGQKMRFLICQSVPTNLIFDVLEMILRDYIDLFKTCPQLGSVFESTVIQSMDDFDSLPFITAFINCCVSSSASLCSSLFQEFLEKWKNQNLASVFFFYSIFLSNNTMLPFYLMQSNEFNGLSVIANVFKMVHNTLVLDKPPQKALEFSLKPKSFKRVKTDASFLLTAPIEIVISSIKSFISFFNSNKRPIKTAANEGSTESTKNTDENESTKNADQNESAKNADENESTKNSDQNESTKNSDQNESTKNEEKENESNKNEEKEDESNKNSDENQKLNESSAKESSSNLDSSKIIVDNKDLIFEKFDQLFEYAGEDLKDIYFYSLKYSSIQSFDIVSKSFIKFLTESLFKFKELDVLINFDVLTDSQKMNSSDRASFFISEKKLRWDQVLNRIVNDCPQIFAQNWYLLFASLFAISEDTVNLSPSFARKFDDEQTKEVLKSLIAVRPFPHLFINDFLISNIERFDKLWPILDDFFDEEIGRNSKIDDKIFELFIDMILKAFVSKTECQLLELGTKILKSTKSVSLDKKLIVLKNLRNVFAEQSQEMKKGYPFLFEILDPEMYDKDLLTIAFQMFSVICTDYIHTADPIYVRPCLELIFKYAQQSKDINISLSSFDLIWNVVKTMEKNDDNWTHFLFRISDLFYDERSDVAHCAVKTFFTYLTSNFPQISEKTIDYFISKGFVGILNRFQNEIHDCLSIIEQVLYEIIHFFVTFWHKLTFKNSHIELYITKNEELIMKCTNNDMIINAYQFYDCLLSGNVIDEELNNFVVQSLTRIADDKLSKIPNINSSVVSQFGRLLGNILKSFPKRSTDDKNGFSEKDTSAFNSYIELIEHIATTFRNDEYVHITTQRALDAMGSIIAFIPLKQAEDCIAILKRLFERDDTKLKETICMVMEDAFVSVSHAKIADVADKNEKSESSSTDNDLVDESNLLKLGNRRRWILTNCREQLLSPFGEKFAKKVVSKKVCWGDKDKLNDVKELFVLIKEKYPNLANNASIRLNELE